MEQTGYYCTKARPCPSVQKKKHAYSARPSTHAGCAAHCVGCAWGRTSAIHHSTFDVSLSYIHFGDDTKIVFQSEVLIRLTECKIKTSHPLLLYLHPRPEQAASTKDYIAASRDVSRPFLPYCMIRRLQHTYLWANPARAPSEADRAQKRLDMLRRFKLFAGCWPNKTCVLGRHPHRPSFSP